MLVREADPLLSAGGALGCTATGLVELLISGRLRVGRPPHPVSTTKIRRVNRNSDSLPRTSHLELLRDFWNYWTEISAIVAGQIATAVTLNLQQDSRVTIGGKPYAEIGESLIHRVGLRPNPRGPHHKA